MRWLSDEMALESRRTANLDLALTELEGLALLFLCLLHQSTDPHDADTVALAGTLANILIKELDTPQQ